MKIVENEKYKVGGHYSQGVVAGDFLFTCGHVAYNPETGELATASITEETRQILDNLTILAQKSGTTLNKAVKVGVFLTDMKYFEEFNKAYAEYFPVNPPPRTTVQIGPLLRTVHIEIDMIIYLGTE